MMRGQKNIKSYVHSRFVAVHSMRVYCDHVFWVSAHRVATGFKLFIQQFYRCF